jgi:hypothetical protein
LLGVEAGIVEDAGEGSALELSVQRHRKRDPSVGVLHPHMAAALADTPPTGTFEGLYEALTGEDR